jgi:DNA-binding MarR family transcriptional regulator
MGHGNTQPVWRRAATHLLHTALLLKADVEERLQRETGMLLADNEALLNLAAAETPLRMSEIADRLVLSRGGATKVIDRLEQDGLARRSQDPDDRRALIVEITPEGRDMLETTRAVVDAALTELWAQHLTDDEAEQMLAVVDKIRRQNPGWSG